MDEEKQKKRMDFLVSPEATLEEQSLQSGFMRSVWENFGAKGVRKVIAGRKGGSAIREESEKDWEDYQDFSNKVAGEHPRWGRMMIVRKVSREYGVSEKTILRRTKLLKEK